VSQQEPAARPKERFNLEEHFPFKLTTASNLLQIGAVRQFQKHYGIRGREWRVLVVTGLYGPTGPAEISARAALDKATVSRALEVLRRKGMVEKRPDAHDRRRSVISLTGDGVALHDRIVQFVKKRARQIDEVFTAEQNEQFCALLDMLIENLRKINEKEAGDTARERAAGQTRD